MPPLDATGGAAAGAYARSASAATRGLPAWTGLSTGRSTPEEIRDAFEALLVAEVLKPFEESLTASGLFPGGAAGDIYAHFWKQHLGALIARQLDLFPGLAAGNGAAQPSPALQGPLRRASAGAAPAAPVARTEAAAAATPAAPIAPAGSEALLTRSDAGALLELAGRVARSAAQASPAAAPADATAHAAASRAPRPGDALGATDHPFAERLAPFEEAIREAAEGVRLGANWLRAVILQESGGDAQAVSPRGAQGLMQILPATGRALGLRDPFDPAENIRAGARYLTGLLTQFGDIRLALAAYNAGPGRVSRYGGIPPFRETQTYVRRVLALKEELDRLIPGGSGASLP